MILVVLSFFAATSAPAAEPALEQLEFFEAKVRPILAEHCYKCHSVQSEKLKGGLLLDSHEGVMKGGEDGPVITPGEPERSKLVEAIKYQNPDLQMPPKVKLPDDQIATLIDWVKMGAPWPLEQARKPAGTAPPFDLEKRRGEHWAWQPINARNPPAVQNTRWPMTAADRFILAKLEENHLQPAPPADRRTLIRRLSFDLVGLPPTPEEVDRYVRDSSPEAYEEVVDHLLASPQFGERWARHWLDLVRYAETLGHEFDYPLHNAWRYRDYVIRAFNADVPYNQFVTEHIAGDLLPDPRRHPTEHFNESVIGTGFFWLGQRDHSPVDVRLHQAELIDNQIDVLSKTFLGLTVACARCHDHKFDAIAAKDFYALYGVLESSHYSQKAIDPPEQLGPKVGKLKELKKQIRRAAASEWSKQADRISKYLLAAATAHTNIDSGQTSSGLEPDLIARWAKALSEPAVSDSNHALYPWHELSAIRTTQHTSGPPSAVSVQKTSTTNRTRPDMTDYEVYAQASGHGFDSWFADGEAFSMGTGGPGDFIVGDTDHPLTILHEPALNDSVLSRRLEGVLRSPSFEIRHRYLHFLAAGRASRIRVCVDNFTMIRDPIYGGLVKHLDNDQSGWLAFDLDMWQGHRAHIELCDLATPDPTEDWKGDDYRLRGYVSASQVVLSDHATPPEVTNPPAWLRLLGSPPADSLETLANRYQGALRQAIRTWSSDQPHYSAKVQAELAFLDWLVQHGLLGGTNSGPLANLIAEYHQVESSISEPKRVPAMTDGNGIDEHIFIRGNHKTLGELAPRRFLTALSNEKSVPFQTGSGRLELARCMTDASNPLLSRVMVNRVWLYLFGRGIVPTPDDFGVLGERPTHPELLDWLANWYRTDAGWSTRKLIRLLVTSSAYRMSSKSADFLAEEKDPGNLLFHRMPIKRLEGENIRDAMLALSGRLDDAMFGPSVPTHLTEFMDGRGRPGASGPVDGAGRRSIYLEVRRNFLSPMMRTFDTPVPFSTIGRRTVSNIPAQSLILLNDAFVLGQAQLWARRILGEKNSSPEQRITRIYQMAFGRHPTEEERMKAMAFLAQQGMAYGAASPACWQDEKVWTDFCHVVFNVKEFIFVE